MYVSNQLARTFSSDLPKNKHKIYILSDLCFALALARTFSGKNLFETYVLFWMA